MSDLGNLLWLIPGLPLLAAALIAFLGPKFLKDNSHWPCIVSIGAAFVVAAVVFFHVYGAEEWTDKAETVRPVSITTYYTWIKAGTVDVGLTLRADALTCMMLVMITFIATFIAIYATGYMHHEPGYPRFFAAVSLFVASMTTLVLADNFIVLFVGWEGVGLCSYLLIGFWFTKPSAADAARKALLVTRLGDVGMFLGILVLWGMYGSVDFDTVFSGIESDHKRGIANHGLLFTAALLLFCGAVGKSAQFPLHVWLPDAMEGPTPVSALIHAATMVTAGVYLVARCTPLFLAVPDAQFVVACIGGITALLAALIALTQTDLKRVLAYSTLSQLGYMFLALGCAVEAGGKHLVTFAVTAAMFHLFTHAFFKALLFLGAGSVMHAMGGVIDMRKFSGLKNVMPKTHWTFLCGCLALSGAPIFSGFWSKDEILDAAWQAGQTGTGSMGYLILLGIGLVTAFLTAFYTFRAYFKTFHGQEHIPHEAHGHAHESPANMTVPLMVLAVFALGIGFLLGPVMPKALQFAHFIEKTPYWPHEAHEHHSNWGLMGLSTLLALSGIGLAWLMYIKQPELPGQLARSLQGLYQLSLNKFYLDELYLALFVRRAEDATQVTRKLDQHGVDAGVDLIGHTPGLVGWLFRPVQNGLVQFYALAMVLGLAVFLLALLRPQ